MVGVFDSHYWRSGLSTANVNASVALWPCPFSLAGEPRTLDGNLPAYRGSGCSRWIRGRQPSSSACTVALSTVGLRRLKIAHHAEIEAVVVVAPDPVASWRRAVGIDQPRDGRPCGRGPAMRATPSPQTTPRGGAAVHSPVGTQGGGHQTETRQTEVACGSGGLKIDWIWRGRHADLG